MIVGIVSISCCLSTPASVRVDVTGRLAKSSMKRVSALRFHSSRALPVWFELRHEFTVELFQRSSAMPLIARKAWAREGRVDPVFSLMLLKDEDPLWDRKHLAHARSGRQCCSNVASASFPMRLARTSAWHCCRDRQPNRHTTLRPGVVQYDTSWATAALIPSPCSCPSAVVLVVHDPSCFQ